MPITPRGEIEFFLDYRHCNWISEQLRAAYEWIGDKIETGTMLVDGGGENRCHYSDNSRSYFYHFVLCSFKWKEKGIFLVVIWNRTCPEEGMSACLPGLVCSWRVCICGSNNPVARTRNRVYYIVQRGCTFVLTMGTDNRVSRYCYERWLRVRPNRNHDHQVVKQPLFSSLTSGFFLPWPM